MKATCYDIALTLVKVLPDAAAPSCPYDRPGDRASRLCADRSAAGSRRAPRLPGRGSCSAGTPTAVTAWPDPNCDPRLHTAAAAAAWRHEQTC